MLKHKKGESVITYKDDKIKVIWKFILLDLLHWHLILYQICN